MEFLAPAETALHGTTACARAGNGSYEYSIPRPQDSLGAKAGIACQRQFSRGEIQKWLLRAFYSHTQVSQGIRMEAPREGAIINNMQARTARNSAKKTARRIVRNTNTVRNEGTANRVSYSRGRQEETWNSCRFGSSPRRVE
jgi:hypothetical protein